MCGRYIITSPLQAILDMFEVDPVERPNMQPRYNLAPTQVAPVVRRAEDGTRSLALLRWGLIPHWAKDTKIGARMINARSETVSTMPAFRESYHKRRCLVVADGFFEWRREGRARRPFLIARADGGLMAFAGLWSRWRDPQGADLTTFTILTTKANAVVADIHDRMPVILRADAYGCWLDPTLDAEAVLRPVDASALAARPVSDRVNNVRNDDPGILEPPPHQPTLL